jgi:RNA polymerase sigma-70 factor (ECF subfamily)
MSKHVLNTRLSAGQPRIGSEHGRHWRHVIHRDGPAGPDDYLYGPVMTLTGPDGRARRSSVEVANDRGSEPASPAEADRRLTELYRSESPKLVRLFSRRTRNPEDAQDLVQDVFFRFARLREHVLGLEKPQAYLRRIASNLLKDRAKTDARHNLSLHVAADEEVLAGIDQERALESRDMLRRLEAAMMKLRPKTREIFVAHRIEGLSYSEIARRTGLSVKGVEKQMSKAILQLDRLLHRSRNG